MSKFLFHKYVFELYLALCKINFSLRSKENETIEMRRTRAYDNSYYF